MFAQSRSSALRPALTEPVTWLSFARRCATLGGMCKQLWRLFPIFLGLAPFAAGAQADVPPLLRERWFEARTGHFNLYSCGNTQQVAKLAARLEQFRQAYSFLAGAQSVASPPIAVMAFPDYASMQPFLPVHDGKPASLMAFFHRGSDENLIVLPLIESVSLQAIFHEYAHLLLRHNDPFWPLWLKEGMAEIYGTLQVLGGHTIRIGKALPEHVQLLEKEPLLPLRDLFAVTHESAEYNERDRQGIFYAESWLLTQFLMLGDNPSLKGRFGQLTALLRDGQLPEQAFTNAFRLSLPVLEKELQRYLARGKFDSLDFSVTTDLSAPSPLATRPLGTIEVCFRLGDELLRIDRPETAEVWFRRAEQLGPRSPLPQEGLGLLAAEREQPDEAVRFLGQALQRGSVSFLAHYIYAAQKLRLASHSATHYVPVKGPPATEIRAELEKSLSLMPDFAGAHHLLGIFELLQEEDPAAAEKHLRRAIQLEPENLAYLFSLAQAQLLKDDLAGARKTLDLLRRPYVEAKLRAHAGDLLKDIERESERTRVR